MGFLILQFRLGRTRCLKMLVRKSVAAFLILSVIIVAYVFPVSAAGDQTKAKTFIQIAERAGEVALEFVERAKAAGENVSLAARLTEEGRILLNRAKTAYEKCDYDSATADAKSAQNKFRDALKTLGPEKESIEEQMSKGRLLETIERSRERMRRIRAALSNMTEINEVQKGEIDTRLIQAEGLLNDAEQILAGNGKSASEAAGKLAQTEKLIAEALVMLRSASREPNKPRIEAYLKILEREISQLGDYLDKLEKEKIKVDDLRELLSKAEDLVGNARDKSVKDDLAGALVDVHQAREIMSDVRKEISQRQKS